MLLRHVATAEGNSQQAMGQALDIPPSRMVALVDDLEQRGMLERRPNPDDRRARALYLTNHGREVLETVMKIGAEHEAELCAGLDEAERARLVELLTKVVSKQGLRPGVHPAAGIAGSGP
jgi:DNA-binding MarR family transcriptional regulator